MKLCLDVGNSQIFGGVFENNNLLLKFRHETHRTSTSDQLGIFLKSVLRENNLDTQSIEHIAISSVVPPIDYSIGSACIKYFNLNPFWIRPGIKTGLKLKVKHPNQIGADLIASSIAAITKYPAKNIVIVSLGTATTYVPVSSNKEFLGAVIQAGVRTSMQSLESHTEQLPSVQIVKTDSVLGRDTTTCIQSGLYYGQLGAIKEIINGINQECFSDEKPIIIGTGGFTTLFSQENIFTEIDPDLILNGILIALKMNIEE